MKWNVICDCNSSMMLKCDNNIVKRAVEYMGFGGPEMSMWIQESEQTNKLYWLKIEMGIERDKKQSIEQHIFWLSDSLYPDCCALPLKFVYLIFALVNGLHLITIIIYYIRSSFSFFAIFQQIVYISLAISTEANNKWKINEHIESPIAFCLIWVHILHRPPIINTSTCCWIVSFCLLVILVRTSVCVHCSSKPISFYFIQI